jgi:pyrroline-5-carboxylate reductase
MRQGGSMKVAFIGGGNMARALITGLLRAGHAAENISVGEPLEAQRAQLQSAFGVGVHADNAAAIAAADVTVLAVKPQDALAVLRALPPRSRLLISIAAGLRIAQLREASAGVHVVRAMPNRPALVGAGVTGAFAAPEVTAPERERASAVLASAGGVVWVQEESQLDLVTALSGSGPAYFFLLAEQLAAAGTRAGLPADVAARLAAGTLQGAGALVHAALATHKQPAEALAAERAAVTSKGGTTEAALRALAKGGFDSLVARAFDAAAGRSAELAALLARDH